MCWGGENPGFNPPGGKIWPIKKKRILEKLYMVVDGDCHEGSPLNHISYDVETTLGFWTQRANSDQLVMWNKENNSVSKRYSSRIIVPIGGVLFLSFVAIPAFCVPCSADFEANVMYLFLIKQVE